jgi:hypothetical protein
MLALAKQHLQQHAALNAAQQRAAERHQPRAASAASAASSRAAALADFPLAAPSASKGKTAKGTSKATSLQRNGESFAARSTRRASSKGVLKRAKQLQRLLPRPSLLEKAERALQDQEAKGGAEVRARNERILTHQSERKRKTQEAMKKFLMETTKPSRHAAAAADEEDNDDERDDYDDADIDDLMS